MLIRPWQYSHIGKKWSNACTMVLHFRNLGKLLLKSVVFVVHYSETGTLSYSNGRKGQDLFVATMLTSQRVHPPREPTYSGEVAAGYMKGCLPFAVGATVTVAIVSLDIITDWIMYKAVLDNNIPSAVKSYTASNKTRWRCREQYRMDAARRIHPASRPHARIPHSWIFCVLSVFLVVVFHVRRTTKEIQGQTRWRSSQEKDLRTLWWSSDFATCPLWGFTSVCNLATCSDVMQLYFFLYFWSCDIPHSYLHHCLQSDLEICTSDVELWVLQFPG